MSRKTIWLFAAVLICYILAIIAKGSPDITFYHLVSIIPLVLILVLLFMQVDMLIAALAGGVMAMIIGGIGMAGANAIMMETVPKMLSNTVPIINSAVATAVFKAGGYTAALTLVRRSIGGRLEFVAAFIVILQSAATYMSGIGGGSAMVIAPLAFAALGANRYLIAGMSIATAASFTTSPASLESSVVSDLSGTPIAEYVATMQPIWLLFVVLSIVIAFIGTLKEKGIFIADEDDGFANKTRGELWKLTLPAIFLLTAVIAGPSLNKLIIASGLSETAIFGPLMYTIVTIALIYFCSELSAKQSVEAMVSGSQYILTCLFTVGLFLTFIYVIEKTGAFDTIASVIGAAPAAMVVPVAVLVGFLIGVPAGAYVGSILTLVLPITVVLGFTPMQIGMVAIGVGLGSQLSLVNITMQALSAGFKIPIIQVSRGNLPFVAGAVILLLVISAFV
ncbi:hypothetical protein WMO13_10140 [Ignatzschineria larvae DSM 13226]|uniref:Citrate transporter n=1 Tax=Ignatzschineria larvae DSM 13226 TaxID=1111732 RepID=A0ABZ3BYT5_9GAMM|nr:hypothetical protein [Ignatzschineria larvae]